MMTTMAAPVGMTYGTTTMAAASPVGMTYGTTTMAAAPSYAYAEQPAYTQYAQQPVYETYAAAPAVTYAAAAPSYVPQQQMVQTMAPQQQMVQTMAAPTYAYAEQPAYTQYAQQPMYEQTYAMPQATYAAPMTTQVASYVAPPVSMAMPGIIAPAAPMQPQKLTAGIPTPEQISQQKNGYSAALDKQLKDAIETVQKETAIEKEMVKFTADKTIALYNMQVDEKLVEALAMADEQSTFAQLELNKAKVERNLQLSSQASNLVMDYQMKAVQTELQQKQYAFQTTYMKAENKLAEEYNKQVALANTGTTYVR